ncbi:hypothetical protein L1049_012900 [Liquidambar formosana]|uniref:Late embryogenesis abundant protein LEA-2 subgroup domain-containing protein n=1 Tax=Liquidambar formosana TaxID=63359 RepID=A0AAP0RJN1_LIQFO
MEDQKTLAIGYPLQFGYPTNTNSASTTTTTTVATNNNNNAVDAHVVQLPPVVPYPEPPCRSRNPHRYCNIGATLTMMAMLALIITFEVYHNKYSTNSPVFRLDSASVSPFNLSIDSQINGNWNISFYVRNPNRWTSIAYDVIWALVFYQDQLLSDGTTSPFQQGRRGQTVVTASLAAKSVHVDDLVRNFIFDDLTSTSGVLDFDLKVEALVRRHPGTLSEAKGGVRVSCNDVKIRFSFNTGTMVGGSRKCKTYLDDDDERGG